MPQDDQDTAGGGRRRSQFATPVESEELEFIQAIEAFKASRGRQFPTWSEVLQVLKELGYQRPESASETICTEPAPPGAAR